MSMHNKLLEYLNDFIINSAPGRQLPSENSLCRKFSVSRMTARKAMNELALSGKITRRQGSGSFVPAQKIFTFLIPNTDIFSKISYSSYSMLLRIHGAMNECNKLNIRFETMAVAPSNDMHCLNTSVIGHLNSCSYIFATVWFMELFEVLDRKRAHVCVEYFEKLPRGFGQYCKNFILISRNRQAALVRTLNYLQHKHCCDRIIMASRYLSDKGNLTCNIARQYAALHRIIIEFVEFSDFIVPGAMSHCDMSGRPGVVFCHGEQGIVGSINQYLGIPSHIPIVGFEYDPVFSPQAEPIPYCTSPFGKIGADSVHMLFSEGAFPKRIIYDFDFHNII